MARIVTNLAKTAMVALLCAGGWTPAFAADEDMPLIMTLTTNIYGYQGPTNSFTIYLGSVVEDAEVYVETATSQEYVTVNPWSLGLDEDGDNAVVATPVSLNVTENDNSVKIYGDKRILDYIDVHGCYISSFVLEDELPNLTVIDLSHNELSAIDLSAQTALASIDLTDNSFNDASQMVIGTNHPGLEILQVGINNVVDPQLSLTNFPKLQYFSARGNPGLYDVDPTQCPDLVSLVLEVTNISSIDVTKCPKLDVLNLSQTRVSEIDVTQNPILGELYINHEGSFNNVGYELTSIDVSKNPLLQYLDLGGNNLTAIDLSNNPDIRLLYLQKNNLSSIDVSNLSKLAVFNISNNYFTYANLPVPEQGWDYYYYRSPLSCLSKYKVGETIDFSSEVLRAPFTNSAGEYVSPETYATVFVAPRGEDEYELDEAAFSFADGKITFNQAVADSVYVRFHNTVFDEWDLTSANFMVKTAEEFDKPSTVFSFTPSTSLAGQAISFRMGAAGVESSVNYPVDVTVYNGDWTTSVKDAVTGASLPSTTNVSFTLPASLNGAVEIALPDGMALTSLAIDGVALNDINLDPSEALSDLQLTNCSLRQISLGYNRALTNLDLSGNQLQTLDLAGVRGDYEKYSLTDINLSDNQLTQLTAVSYSTIANLDLSNNAFTSFDMKYYTGIRNIDLSNNKIDGELSLATVEKLVSANLSGNSITNLVLNTEEDALSDLKSLNVANNKLTLASLPQFSNPNLQYVYAPQAKMQILSVSPAINLSAQNVGNATNYTWKYAANGSVLPSNLYTLTDGAAIFSDSLVGESLYCEMTNDNFPDFNQNPLTTTEVTVALKPEHLVASFVTSESGEAEIGFAFNKSGDNAVYIDWRGDGTEYTPYIYEANASYSSIYRSGTTFAGATAKVYSYESPDLVSVFAMNNTPLKSADLSPMSQLEAVDIHNAGLTDGNLTLPQNENLWELVLDGNNFSNQSFAQFKRITSLNLASNQYKTFDLSEYPNVMFAQLSNNQISEMKFGGNNRIYQLDIADNNLTKLDLTGADGLQELLAANNSLREIDLSPVASTLRALVLSGNNFTFATLPDVSQLASQLNVFYYANQQPITVTCVDNKIDLSAQAYVGSTATDYYWFLGDFQSDVYYDYEQQAFIGEALEGPEDSSDPEYTITDGVTTFLYPQTRNVICAMVNAEYPNLILYTTPTQLTDAGVEGLVIDEKDMLVDVYSLAGIRLKTKVTMSDALTGLNRGIYIINGKKVLVK